MPTVRSLTGVVALACSTTLAFADAGSIRQETLQISRHAPDPVSGLDDLLSAGLNLAGLIGAAPFVDADNPTSAQLRRRAIYNNYRAIVDPVPGGGIGLLWGPQSPGTPSFKDVPFGLIPGWEYKAYLRVPDGQGHENNVPAAVQIPDHFGTEGKRPCIVLAAPSGSRSLYGAISVAEWGLFKGCAIALPGKGTDTGFHLLSPDNAAHAVTGLDGLAGSVGSLGDEAQFALRPSPALQDYIAANPHRVATKHAHSQLNPERLWGRFALEGVEFAFWALNDHFGKKGGRRFDRKNTIVIAAGASNGGGMALRALEEDGKGLIDGLVVTEPMIQPEDGRFVIKFGSDAPFDPKGRSLYDSITLMSVYAACASLAVADPIVTPLLPASAFSADRCRSLKEQGVLEGGTLSQQAAEALAIIRAEGYAKEQDWGIPGHDGGLNLWRGLQVTYANAYGRFAIEDNICGMSFAATDAAGKPAALAAASARQLFANSNGVPPTSGINLIADRAANGPILEGAARSNVNGALVNDLNLPSALCFRALQTGVGLETGRDAARHARLRAGTQQVETSGRLHGRPAIIIHGRQDALIFPNLHSRAYYALNQERELAKSRLTYIEVTTGQHFDAFISSLLVKKFTPATTTPPAPAKFEDIQFAPLHYYFVLAMDSMWAHVTSGGAAALPPSQVVRPTPRGFESYTSANVPLLLPQPSNTPAASDRIVYKNGVLQIPE
jgi:hydroxybutyrate-dimer hydrolase